ncbi:hypothetical protein BDQ12DRAFT_679511 [Crucibulum laeve]|uniref:Uncharacterized protein n=1 Tax=Crucibulum laeve TaxID=68775 RepID=A0A5C3M746_9AGAR|nr:hypothetical protein BDQ12DRAFT_679511 [Crucibulum laeve]
MMSCCVISGPAPDVTRALRNHCSSPSRILGTNSCSTSFGLPRIPTYRFHRSQEHLYLLSIA